MTTFQRIELTDGRKPDEGILALAEEKLGYRPAGSATQAAVDVFRDAGVRPFNREQVEAYMQRPIRRRRTIAVAVASALAVIVFVAAITLVAITMEARFGPLVSLSILPILIIPLLMLSGKEWHEVMLQSYTGEVPTYALQTALDIKDSCRKAGLHNVYLYVVHYASDRKSRTSDPFLMVEIGNEKFYLEYWDEPGFAKERTV